MIFRRRRPQASDTELRGRRAEVERLARTNAQLVAPFYLAMDDSQDADLARRLVDSARAASLDDLIAITSGGWRGQRVVGWMALVRDEPATWEWLAAAVTTVPITQSAVLFVLARRAGQPFTRESESWLQWATQWAELLERTAVTTE